MKKVGSKNSCTPAAIDAEQSVLRIDWNARSAATNDAEHAVSRDKLGPRKPRRNDIRFAAMVPAMPDMKNGEEIFPRGQSVTKHATKTPVGVLRSVVVV
jgi:hypothetical protein